MKVEKKESFTNILAFICLVIIAVLEIFNFCSHINLFTVEGILMNILSTIQNVCILIVFGLLSFNFAKGKKGLLIAFIIALIIIIASTISLWL